MGTRSTIAYMEAGKIHSVYCHWDGYPEYNGRILQEHYQEARKIGQLIQLGDMSSLGAELGTKHDFGSAPEGVCTFYGRDRGEDDVDAGEFDNIDEWLESYDWSDYAYLWNGREWLVHSYVDRDSSRQPVFNRVEDMLRIAQ